RKRAAGRLGSAEECGAAAQVGAVRENAWKRRRDRGGPAKSPLVRLFVVAPNVERLRAVRQRVERGPGRLRARKLQGEPRLVDDPGEVRAGTSAAHLPRRVADAEEARPLGPRVGRRDRDERPAARTRETSRAGSSPSTRAAASVPAARSASIAEREMKVTP